LQRTKAEKNESKFIEISHGWEVLKKRTITRGKETGKWLADASTGIRATLFFYTTPYHHWAACL
jgi:hypothetical protein